MIRFAVVTIILILTTFPGSAGMLDKLKDPEDGQLDVSGWLLSGSGFLPLPILITEPAVGFGLGLAPAFFHDFNTPKSERGKKGMDLEYPPSATAGFGAYTTNGSWFAGAGHLGSYKRDTIRYVGAVGYASINLEFYPFNTPLRFNLKGAFLYQELKFRLGRSKWFLGGEYTLFDSLVKFDIGETPPAIPHDDLDSKNAGLGAVAYFDSRDSMFTPSNGREARIIVTRYDTAVGGDFKYWQFLADYISFHEIGERWVLGWRVRGSKTDGDTPFWALPFIEMRGVPAMRYQGETVAQVNTEARWQIKGRWSLVGFVGYGDTWTDRPALEDKDLILAGGAGFRYLIARKLKLHSGVDIARGPEDWAIYLTTGHSWGR